MAKEKFYLGIDLGGTKIAVALVDSSGHIVSNSRDWTKAEEGREKVLARICGLVDKVLHEAKTPRGQVTGLGIGAPGAIDRHMGIVHSMTNLPGWEDFSLKEYFGKIYRIPVVLDNDANAAALGEYLFGAGQGFADMIYITVSTGVGGGIISDGHLLHGTWGMAGEVGHMVLDPNGELCNCGNRGCWETISSGTAIAREAKRQLELGGKSLITELVPPGGEVKAEHVFQARLQGDLMAKALTDRALDYLGIGVANLVNVLSPGRVVIGGGVTNAGEILFQAVRNKVDELAFGPAVRVEIVPAKLGTKAGVIGAAALVSNLQGSGVKI